MMTAAALDFLARNNTETAIAATTLLKTNHRFGEVFEEMVIALAALDRVSTRSPGRTPEETEFEIIAEERRVELLEIIKLSDPRDPIVTEKDKL